MNVIFDYLTIYSEILPAILFLFAVKKHKDKGLWVLFFFYLYSFTNGLILYSGWNENLGAPTYILIRLFTVISYTLISWFYYQNIASPLIRKIIIYTYVPFLLYAVYDYLNSPPDTFDSIPSVTEAILVIIFSIFYLFEQIRTPRVFFIYSVDKFWIITGLLIYHTGTFFLFIFTESYIKDPGFWENYVTINNLFLLLKNLFFSIGLLIKNKQNEYSPNSYPNFENYLEKRF